MRLRQSIILAALSLAVPATTAVSLGATKATLYLSPTGADANGCTLEAPCATLDHAYHLAAPGQTVQLAAGSYPKQPITPDNRKTSGPDVVFEPQDGAQVHIGGVAIAGSHVELQNLTTKWQVLPGTSNVTLRNVVSDGSIFITGASNVSVLGGEVYSPAPLTNGGDPQISSLFGKVPTNILFDGVRFHDFRDASPVHVNHIECLQVGAAINLTVRNSTFQNCDTHDIFIRSWGMVNNSPSPLSNIVIENNWLARTISGYNAIHYIDDLWKGTPQTSVTIRNNSSLQTILVQVANGTAVVHGNLIPNMVKYFCGAYGQSRWFDYNVYTTGVTCGAHDRVGDPKYVDAAHFDLHVQAGSAALAAGDPKSHPADDINGNLRPLRGSPDAGASQRETADIVFGKSVGYATVGMSQQAIVQFYGAPRTSKTYRSRAGRGVLATYRVHGGRLWVLYDQNQNVVGVGTTSPYYSTRNGSGVSVPAKRFLDSLNARWVACQKAYRRAIGSVFVYVAGRARAASAPVGSVWMVQRSFDGCRLRPR